MKQFKAFFAAVVMMMTSQVVMAQTTVKGVLMDETLGEAEPFATVRVFKAGKKEKPVAMFLTKEDGQFSQEVKGKGKFDIVFSSVGKEDLRQTVTLGQENPLDLGTLYMKENATMLKGVEIVAQKPLVKMEVDKMSYNVAEDEDSKSNTVLDMLRKVPMVTVDGQDNITVNGSSSFKVYVDGMPNAMFSSNPSMVFKSMPATAVKSKPPGCPEPQWLQRNDPCSGRHQAAGCQRLPQRPAGQTLLQRQRDDLLQQARYHHH